MITIKKEWVYIGDIPKRGTVYVRLTSGETKPLSCMKKDDWSEEALQEAGRFVLVLLEGLVSKLRNPTYNAGECRAAKVKLESGSLKLIISMTKQDWTEKPLAELAWRLQRGVDLVSCRVAGIRKNSELMISKK